MQSQIQTHEVPNINRIVLPEHLEEKIRKSTSGVALQGVKKAYSRVPRNRWPEVVEELLGNNSLN